MRFEGLRPGDVFEIQYLVEDVASDNQMADYFGDLQYIAENIPKRRWDYTLIAPASRPIHANVPKLAQLQRQVTEEGSERVYRYTARDIAKIDAEPAMPGPGETTPYLHVSTYATLDRRRRLVLAARRGVAERPTTRSGERRAAWSRAT